jgi:hypothetical protein
MDICLGVVSLDHMVVLFFSVLRDHCMAFHRSCSNIKSHHILVSNCCLCDWCVCAIVLLTGVRMNLNVVLIFISFMTKDVEHFFISLLFICTSSLRG